MGFNVLTGEINAISARQRECLGFHAQRVTNNSTTILNCWFTPFTRAATVQPYEIGASLLTLTLQPALLVAKSWGARV